LVLSYAVLTTTIKTTSRALQQYHPHLLLARRQARGYSDLTALFYY